MPKNPESAPLPSSETLPQEITQKSVQSFLEAAFAATNLCETLSTQAEKEYVLKKILEYLLRPISSYLSELKRSPANPLDYKKLKAAVEEDILDLQRELEHPTIPDLTKPNFKLNVLHGTFTALCNSLARQVNAGKLLTLEELQKRSPQERSANRDGIPRRRGQRGGVRR